MRVTSANTQASVPLNTWLMSKFCLNFSLSHANASFTSVSDSGRVHGSHDMICFGSFGADTNC